MTTPYQLAPQIHVSRRTLLRLAAGLAGSAAWPALEFRQLAAQQPKASGEPLAPLNRFSRMVQEWFVAEVRAAETKIKERLAALQTKAEAEAYVRSVQERIRECFGQEPERTPLNARVTGVVERDAYRIEKVVFESRPDFPVTANL